MHGAATDLDSIGKHILMGMSTGKARQQSRMDIHDPARILTHEIRRQDTHETGQYDQRNAGCLQLTDEGLLKGLTAIELLAVDADSLDAGFRRPFQGKGIRLVREDNRDLSCHLATVNGIHDGLEVRPPAGAEDAQFLFCLSHGIRRL